MFRGIKSYRVALLLATLAYYGAPGAERRSLGVAHWKTQSKVDSVRLAAIQPPGGGSVGEMTCTEMRPRRE
jgi:hypothetical protein